MTTQVPNYILTINNKKIWTFYKEHPHLKFEDMCVIFHDFVERFSNDLSSSLNTALNNQILSTVSEQNLLLNGIKTQLNTFDTSVSSSFNDMKGNMTAINTNIQQMIIGLNKIGNDIVSRFNEIKRDYNESISSIVENKTDKLTNLIEKNNLLLFEKTNQAISSIPDNIQVHIKTVIRDFQDNIARDTQQIISNLQRDNSKSFSLSTNEILQTYMNSFDLKYSTLIQNIQNPIITQISNLRESNSLNKQRQDIIFNDLSTFLNKYKASSHKGNLEQNHLESVLNSLFPSGEVISTARTTACCDILLKRNDKPSILFENKDYEANVNRQEVEKFVRDIDSNNYHGIFLSQSSGITSKENFQIDINNDKILLYIHNVKYSKDIIHLSVEIIDKLHDKLSKLKIIELDCDDDDNEPINNGFTIDHETLIKINNEFKSLLVTKQAIIKKLNEDHSNIIKFINNSFILPELDILLSTKFPKDTDNNDGGVMKCDICKTFQAPNKRSLAAHKKGCVRHQQYNTINAK